MTGISSMDNGWIFFDTIKPNKHLKHWAIRKSGFQLIKQSCYKVQYTEQI